MAGENEGGDKSGTAGGTGGAGTGTPPGDKGGTAGGTSADGKGGTSGAGSADDKNRAAGTAGAGTSSAIKLEDDDDNIDLKQSYELKGAMFKKRIDRANKSLLREMFGSDDREKILADFKRREDIEKKSEDERRKKLEKEQLLEEDNKKLKSDLEKERARATAAEERQMVDREVTRVSRLAGKFVDSDYVDDLVHGPFKRHLSGLSERELEKMGDKDIEEWFKEYVTTKPKFAKGEAEVRQPPKVGGTNGVPANQRPAKAPNAGEKTARPGQANSMTPAEYKSLREQTLREHRQGR